jgi:hypothetical protein
MNEIFNARRFGLLIRKTLLERPTQMFGFTALILGTVLIAYFICKSQFGFQPAQNLTFIWGLAGGGSFLASFVFAHFSTNASGSFYLSFPASIFEKWLAGVLIAGIFYPIIFLLFYRGMDASFIAFYRKSLDPENPLYKIQYNSVYLFSFTGRIAYTVYLMTLLFTGVAIIGSLYFNKAGFIKTALSFCTICFLLFGLNWVIANLIFGKIEMAFPFREVDIMVGKSEGTIQLPGNAFNVSLYFFGYILPLSLWALSFLRLKEKEF